MDSNIETIYSDLLHHVTEKKLKDISVEVISRYKAKDLNALLRFADILEFNASGMNISRLFARVIQHYHPDKISMILSSIEENYKEKKVPELLRLKRIYIFNKRKSSAPDKRYDIDVEETYSYGDEYSGYEDLNDSYYGDLKAESEFDLESDNEINPHEYGFIEAVNKMFFGGIDDSITVEDLHNLEGELDLSDSDIYDLKGIEQCRNITILNLSGNRIDRIERLAGLEMLECLYLSDNEIESIDCLVNLKNLKELDISFNNIEDIAVLLGLGELIYVNIMENPVKNREVIKMLEERGVIVIE